MTALLMEIIPTPCELCVNYKLSPRHFAFSFEHFFSFSHNNHVYTGLGMYSQATPGILNARVTGWDKFARN